ncbi:MAG: NADH-quinone oxidoreductase subunit L [Candidatus Eisenbacteria bacterium]|nr:NADH-quinone oxidoreductase subunit L [Candidatus Eisenbacteria bacterium]
MDFRIAALVPLFPLLGFLFNLFLGRRVSKGVVGLVACGTVFLSFLASVALFVGLRGLEPASRQVVVPLFDWIDAGSLHVPLALLVDPLSVVMILVVTGVGFLIHVYSTGYMEHDEGFARYFTYLNLFTFSMLLLVLGSSFVTLFVGWEGVGLCSYLLIGFWYEKKSATDAGKKAFIVNRVGDFGFALGMMLIFWNMGSLNFVDVFKAAGSFHAGDPVLTAICLLLFVGACGKSAQLPLYVWLPDAMEGPTPVSALIHAATMVTAGVYMVARCHVLYVMSPTALTVVAVVGGATALFAATIGLVQNDIKRVLAYSTVSQLGYMFLALGVGAFTAGIFHLMTHAFFKALLFLGSGSVIHALSGEQDMRHMGSLKGPLKRTYTTFLIGTLALAGIFPLAGFFSKDEILWSAFQGHRALWVVGVLGAFCTAFYMFRAVYMTFFGESRLTEHAKHHLHESPNRMLVPLYVLAALSIVGGWIGLPKPMMPGGNPFTQWLEPVFGAEGGEAAAAAGAHAAEAGGHAAGHSTELMLMVFSLAVALLGILVAWTFYRRRPGLPGSLGAALPGAYRTLLNKYYVDEFYGAAVIRPFVSASQALWTFFDVRVVDAAVNGAGQVVRAVGGTVRRVQSGYVGGYALAMVLGVMVVLGFYFLR